MTYTNTRFALFLILAFVAGMTLLAYSLYRIGLELVQMGILSTNPAGLSFVGAFPIIMSAATIFGIIHLMFGMNTGSV